MHLIMSFEVIQNHSRLFIFFFVQNLLLLNIFQISFIDVFCQFRYKYDF